MNDLASLSPWEPGILRFLARRPAADPAHGPLHLRRVVTTAVRLAEAERARLDVVWPAAWLHDCVPVAKDASDRAQAARKAASHAVAYLEAAGYPADLLPCIAHAIEGHSHSAGIAPRTPEARIVQDADRLDALGAIGIARCIEVGSALGRPLYRPDDPFCERREPDDASASIDHFYAKLLELAGGMQTEAGRREAERRALFMRSFLEQLRTEIA